MLVKCLTIHSLYECVCVCAWNKGTLIFCVRCGSLTHSGLVKSSGESQWELLSLVDNTQRGSQQRDHTGESYYQQSTRERQYHKVW